MPAMIYEWETEKGKMSPNMRSKVMGIPKLNIENISYVVYFPQKLMHLVELMDLDGEVVEVEDGSTIVVVCFSEDQDESI